MMEYIQKCPNLCSSAEAISLPVGTDDRVAAARSGFEAIKPLLIGD